MDNADADPPISPENALIAGAYTLFYGLAEQNRGRLFRSSRNFEKRCAHIGCSLPRSGSGYCCGDHQRLAASVSKAFPFEYVDSFLDENERKRVCCTLLYNRRRGFLVGVPHVEHATVGPIFSKPPWEQPHLFRNRGTPVDFLFFMDPPSRYRSMTINGYIKLKWHSRLRLGIQLRGFEDEDTVFMTQFFLDLQSEFRDDNDDLFQRCKSWYLFLFQSGQHSLYCLTSSKGGGLVEPKVDSEQRNKKVPPTDALPPTDAPPSTSSSLQPGQSGPPNQSHSSSAGKGNTSSAKPPMPQPMAIPDSQHGFVVECATHTDVHLGFHLDDADLTSDVSLSKQYEGGEVCVRGTRCKNYDVNTDSNAEVCESFSVKA